LTNFSTLLKFSHICPPESKTLGIYPSGDGCEKGNLEYARSKALKDGRSFVFGKLFWAGKI
jgi:hypothetical protein